MLKTWLIRRRYDQLRDELAISRKLLDDPHQLSLADPRVSGWSVAMHVEHLLLTDTSILKLLLRIDANSSEPRARPSLIGRVVLLVGIRPRGVAKAPAEVVPSDGNSERLHELFDRASGLVEQVGDRLGLLSEARWSHAHHLLGRFNASQWLRFMTVHHQHHGRIIDDIRRAGKVA